MTCFLHLQRYGGSEGEERELYVDVKPVEMVGTDMITRKQRYGWVEHLGCSFGIPLVVLIYVRIYYA